MNKADGERLAREFVGAGHTPTQNLADATAVIVNGCAVRENADRKVWGILGLLHGAKRQRPELLVGLTGCTVHADRTELQPHLRPVDVLFDTLNAEPMIARMSQTAPGTDAYEDLESAPAPGAGQVSRYVNIIYGCDKRCTYCIVPFRRGAQRSRPLSEIAAEALRFVDEGAREIVLVGQIVNAYGMDLNGHRLPDVLATVASLPGVDRVRFVTAHPQFMTEQLALAMRDIPNVCEEINLPVQSGDNTVLKRMARGYGVEKYRETVAMLRALVPKVSVTTDVIVGFCGETDSQFNRSRQLVEDLRFDQVHVAAFSPRSGTTAAGWSDDVPADEKLRRLHEIERVQTPIARAINAELVEGVEDVLLESLEEGKGTDKLPIWRGRSRTNKLVFLPAETEMTLGQTIPVRITAATPWSLRGAAQSVAAPA
jgi:tRNA-2-methylthio-N6-dimethylallyladenosine synthase